MTSAQFGASRTSAGRMPWMRMLPGENRICGGRISRDSRRTTRPPSIQASPTAQALSRRSLAVSKSIATTLMPLRLGARGSIPQGGADGIRPPHAPDVVIAGRDTNAARTRYRATRG